MRESKTAKQPRSVDQGLLHAREMRIAQSLKTGATDGTTARSMLGMPSNVTGLTIVDMGAGASSLVADLVADGADAYGVDPIYEDPSTLEAKAKKEVENLAARYARHNQPQLGDKVRASFARFMASYSTDPERYIAGWMGNIPRERKSADIVTSVNGISLLGQDLELMLKALHEAIRVAKRQVIMVPYNTTSTPNTEHAVNHRAAANRLRSEGHKVVIEPVSEIVGSTMLRMKINPK